MTPASPFSAAELTTRRILAAKSSLVNRGGPGGLVVVIATSFLRQPLEITAMRASPGQGDQGRARAASQYPPLRVMTARPNEV
jgi:hypothetical protein